MVELPLYRWWTDGFSLPVEVEMLKYCGAATWRIRFPIGSEPEVEEEQLFADEWDACEVFLRKTEELAVAIEKLRYLARIHHATMQTVIEELENDRLLAKEKLGR